MYTKKFLQLTGDVYAIELYELPKEMPMATRCADLSLSPIEFELYVQLRRAGRNVLTEGQLITKRIIIASEYCMGLIIKSRNGIVEVR